MEVQDCRFCRYKACAERISQRLRHTKYIAFRRNISIILRKVRSPVCLQFIDLDSLSQTEECLKRVYAAPELAEKLKMLTDYYKFHEDVPKIFMKSASAIVHTHYDRTRKLNYARVMKMLQGDGSLPVLRSAGDKKAPGDQLRQSLVEFLPLELKHSVCEHFHRGSAVGPNAQPDSFSLVIKEILLDMDGLDNIAPSPLAPVKRKSQTSTSKLAVPAKTSVSVIGSRAFHKKRAEAIDQTERKILPQSIFQLGGTFTQLNKKLLLDKLREGRPQPQKPRQSRESLRPKFGSMDGHFPHGVDSSAKSRPARQHHKVRQGSANSSEISDLRRRKANSYSSCVSHDESRPRRCDRLNINNFNININFRAAGKDLLHQKVSQQRRVLKKTLQAVARQTGHANSSPKRNGASNERSRKKLSLHVGSGANVLNISTFLTAGDRETLMSNIIKADASPRHTPKPNRKLHSSPSDQRVATQSNPAKRLSAEGKNLARATSRAFLEAIMHKPSVRQSVDKEKKLTTKDFCLRKHSETSEANRFFQKKASLPDAKLKNTFGAKALPAQPCVSSRQTDHQRRDSVIFYDFYPRKG